jgi:hypothetical protein
MILFNLLQVELRDHGQAYTETDFSRFIVEPWNFVTALFFLFLAIYWLNIVRKNIRSHGFMFAMLILLTIGGIGGSIYHGFRYHQAFLMMDWMPIMLITFSASVYYFIRAWGKWWPPLILLLVYFFTQGLFFRSSLTIQTKINISYATMSLIVLFPIVWYLSKTGFIRYRFVLFALLSFVVALFFRWTDKFAWLPFGTHFLWHIFGLIAVHLMLKFVYLSNESSAENNNFAEIK